MVIDISSWIQWNVVLNFRILELLVLVINCPDGVGLVGNGYLTVVSSEHYLYPERCGLLKLKRVEKYLKYCELVWEFHTQWYNYALLNSFHTCLTIYPYQKGSMCLLNNN